MNAGNAAARAITLGIVDQMASRPLDPEHLEAQVVPRDTEREPIPDPQITEREVEKKVKRKRVKVKARKVRRTKEKARKEKAKLELGQLSIKKLV